MSRYSEILAVGRSRYRSLVFDFTELNNVDQYFDSYHIPSEENPVVYAYSSEFSSFAMEGSGTIITDQAIYFHPSHYDWAPSNRIPLSDICHYLIYQEDSKDNVHFLSRSQEFRIFGRTVAPNDTAGEELVELLHSLQQNLIRANKQEKSNYEYTLAWAMAYVRKGFHENGVLRGKYRKILDIIGKTPAFSSHVLLLRAEHKYRLCNEEAYLRFLENMEGAADRDLIESLKKPEVLFFESFVEDISNVHALHMTKNLVESYSSLRGKLRLTLYEAAILCFLCIRMDDEDFFEELFDLIRPALPRDLFWKIRAFAAKYGKEQVSSVYETMLSGEVPKQAQLFWHDDLYLTPLHYALILRNKELVRKMREWDDGHGPLPREKTVDRIYNYVFLASILYDDMDFIEEVFACTSTEARPLRRSIQRMENFLDISVKMRYKAKERLRHEAASQSKALREGALDHYRRHEAAFESLEEQIADYDARIAEYEAMRKEMRQELGVMLQRQVYLARGRMALSAEADHPFVKHLMRVYTEPDGLFHMIADTITGYRLYRYHNVYFLTPPYEEIDLSYYEWKERKIVYRKVMEQEEAKDYFDGDTFENPEERRRIRREEEKKAREKEKRKKEEGPKETISFHISATTYRWFSDDAALDLSTLKREYRALVKKYHPDSSGDASTAAVLQQIMNERADILERMHN